MNRIAIALVFASWPLLAESATAETWSKRLTRNDTGDEMYSFTIKAERLERVRNPEQIDAAGEFLQFHVAVKPFATAEQLKEAAKQGWRPRYTGELRVFLGKEFVSACDLQPIAREAERSYSSQVASKYAEKSSFTFRLTEGEAGDGGISYWFYLQDFVEARD